MPPPIPLRLQPDDVAVHKLKQCRERLQPHAMQGPVVGHIAMQGWVVGQDSTCMKQDLHWLIQQHTEGGTQSGCWGSSLTGHPLLRCPHHRSSCPGQTHPPASMVRGASGGSLLSVQGSCVKAWNNKMSMTRQAHSAGSCGIHVGLSSLKHRGRFNHHMLSPQPKGIR